MKWTLQAVLFLALAGNVQAHAHLKQNADAAVSAAAINVASEKINRNYVAPHMRLKSANAVQAQIEVTYAGFPAEARQAFEYAVSIWEGHLTSTVPVKILAKWENIDGNVLALGRPSGFYVNFEGRPHSHVYYPVALAEKLSGKNINADQPDIICSFNSSSPWYFGTDGNTPVTRYDFVSSALHEITHGLGFSGFLSDENGTGFFDNSNNLPSIYDYYIFNSRNQQISDKSLFNSPSADLHRQLTSNELKIYEPQSTSEKGRIHAPTNWREGISIYHLQDSDNSVMAPYARKGQAIHQPEAATLNILSELGWKSVTFDFEAVRDFEQVCQELPLSIGMFSDFDMDSSSVQLVYSTDYFTTTDSVSLTHDAAANRFAGNLPLDSKMGMVQYYFTARTTENKTFTYPAQAPDKLLSFRVGTDYSAPAIVHQPVAVVSARSSSLEIKARVSDNIGVNSVKIEYRLNGELMEPAELHHNQDQVYSGLVNFPAGSQVSELEYRIIATDKSARGNVKSFPANGYCKVEVFNPLQPVHEYANDFESESADFVSAGFMISALPGFNDNLLHTQTPYINSSFADEKVNMTVQLAQPIIVKEDGVMSFDEVVLVEPGEINTTYNDELFWDYVIVEASKDYGQTWLAITDGYDSNADEKWLSAFTSEIINNYSTAAGNKELLRRHTISLTGNDVIEAGDTVVFRFRLTADNSLNGWGWAIDNLDIQKSAELKDDDSLLAMNDVKTFPNPFSNRFFIDCSNASSPENINVLVTDLFGKTVYHSSGINTSFDPKVEVDLSNSSSGIYLVTVSDGNSVLSSNKMIKN